MYAAHRTPNVIKAAREKGYTMVFVPGGMTSKLQFHDVYVNKPFKVQMRDRYSDHLMQRLEVLGTPAPARQLVGKWIVDSQDRAVTPDLIEKGARDYFFTPDVVVARSWRNPRHPRTRGLSQKRKYRWLLRWNPKQISPTLCARWKKSSSTHQNSLRILQRTRRPRGRDPRET
jgi:hypothetical protein